MTGISSIYCVGGSVDYTSYYALNSSGDLYSWGYNAQGQLGVGDTTLRSKATLATTGVYYVYTIGGYYGSIFIRKANNVIYACDDNTSGHLGVGDTADDTSFTEVTSLSNLGIETIFSGSHSTQTSVFALSSSNRIYVAGYNAQGQLGLYHTTNQTTFTETYFNSLSPVSDILSLKTTGIGGMTIILTEDGETYFAGASRFDWGQNEDVSIPMFFKNTKRICG